MTMTDDEIIVRHRQAKDKKEQIRILAELNDCSVEEIKEIVSAKKEKSNSKGQVTVDDAINIIRKEIQSIDKEIEKLNMKKQSILEMISFKLE